MLRDVQSWTVQSSEIHIVLSLPSGPVQYGSWLGFMRTVHSRYAQPGMTVTSPEMGAIFQRNDLVNDCLESLLSSPFGL